jgi:hypothetical protein
LVSKVGVEVGAHIVGFEVVGFDVAATVLGFKV